MRASVHIVICHHWTLMRQPVSVQCPAESPLVFLYKSPSLVTLRADAMPFLGELHLTHGREAGRGLL